MSNGSFVGRSDCYIFCNFVKIVYDFGIYHGLESELQVVYGI